MLNSSDKRQFLLAAICFILVLGGWYFALCVAPVEIRMGEVYRIIFLHVPSAATALGVTSTGLFICSLIALARPSEGLLRAQKAWAEVGLIFTVLTLFTGSVWAKPTWGTYWTWEPRLTTTLLLALLFIAYLILHDSLEAGRHRIRACSILGIVIFVDVPIIYKSVSWWRTLHQPASLIAERGQSMSPEMLSILLTCMSFTIAFSLIIWRIRHVNLYLRDKVEAISYKQLKG